MIEAQLRRPLGINETFKMSQKYDTIIYMSDESVVATWDEVDKYAL